MPRRANIRGAVNKTFQWHSQDPQLRAINGKRYGYEPWNSTERLLPKLVSYCKYSHHLTRHILWACPLLTLAAPASPHLSPVSSYWEDTINCSFHIHLSESPESYRANSSNIGLTPHRHQRTQVLTNKHTHTHSCECMAYTYIPRHTHTHSRATFGRPWVSIICMLMNLAAGPKHLLPLGPSAPHLPLRKVSM